MRSLDRHVHGFVGSGPASPLNKHVHRIPCCERIEVIVTTDHQMSPSWAQGISFFAGVLLIVGGGFQAIEALAAIVKDEYLVVAPNYIYTFDLTAWGWIHLLIGLAFVAIGICLLLGQGWALIAGIVVAAISALVNFTWLPYSPFWAILLIAVDLLIIWALASARAQARAPAYP